MPFRALLAASLIIAVLSTAVRPSAAEISETLDHSGLHVPSGPFEVGDPFDIVHPLGISTTVGYLNLYAWSLSISLPPELRLDSAVSAGEPCGVDFDGSVLCEGQANGDFTKEVRLTVTAIAPSLDLEINSFIAFATVYPGIYTGSQTDTVDVVGDVSHEVNFSSRQCGALTRIADAMGFVGDDEAKQAQVIGAGVELMSSVADAGNAFDLDPSAPAQDCVVTFEVGSANYRRFVESAAAWGVSPNEYAQFSGAFVVFIVAWIAAQANAVP